MLRLTPLLLFLSGFSALFYQVIWMRLLGLSIGVASEAMAVALASFFLGMSLGGVLAGRLVRRGLYSLKVFALLELTIGITALLLLPLLFHLDQLLAAIPLLAGTTFFKFMIAMLVLVIPASAIGATYPLLVSNATGSDAVVGPRIALFYAFNVIGAVAGTLGVAFIAIPQWGLSGATFVAVTLNAVVAISALALSRYETGDGVRVVETGSSMEQQRPEQRRYLLVLAVSGFVTLGCEVIWSKYLTVLTGTTIYGFAIMLAAVLSGLAVGGFIANAYMARKVVGMRSLFNLLTLLAFILIIMRGSFGEVPVWYEQFRGVAPLTIMEKYFGVLAVVILPSLLLGALYTMAMKLYCGDQRGLQQRIGRGFAVNTLLAVVGSLVTGLWLIPAVGSDRVFMLLIGTLLFTAFMLLSQLDGVKKRTASIALLALCVLLVAMPGYNYERVIRSAERRLHDIETDVFHYTREGRTGMVSVVTHGPVNKYLLQRNGLFEAGVYNADPLLGTLSAALLGTLPVMLQEPPRRVFVIGFGGGTTARLLAAAKPEQLRIAELEPLVVDAMRHLNRDGYTFVDQPGIELLFTDARSLLNRDHSSYDVIVTQSSHPWLAGMANLYSEEYYNIVRDHLPEDGIYLHWVNLFSMDAAVLKSIMATFYRVFPKGAVFAVLEDGEMILVGAKRSLVLDRERVAAVLQQDDYKTALTHHGITQPEDMLKYFLFDREQALRLSQGAELVTDDNLLSEIGLATMLDLATPSVGPMPMLIEASSAKFATLGKHAN